jgi:Redoxin
MKFVILLLLTACWSLGAPVGLDPVSGIATSLSGRKAVAVVFLGTECPVANRYLPALKEWNTALQGQNSGVVGVYSESGITRTDTVDHARKFALDFPVFHDADGSFARSLGIGRLATVTVLDATGRLRYRGRFDSGFAKEGTSVVRSPDAENAMKSVLAGQQVELPETAVSSCTLDGSADGPKVPIGTQVVTVANIPTYHRDIAPLLQARCVDCHSTGGVAPFALDTYAKAKKRAVDMLEEIEAMRMPPWHAAPGKLAFMNANHLTDEEKSLMKRWLDAGATEGSPDKTKPIAPPAPRSEWKIGKPAEILTFAAPEKIPAMAPASGLPYRYVKLGKPFAQERWVRAAQIIPGDRSIVHHAIIHVVLPGQRPPMGNAESEKLSALEKMMLKAMSPEEVGDLVAKEADKEPSMLQAYVPGDDAFQHSADLGRLIPRGAQLIAEMHYTPNGRETTDTTRLGLVYHAAKPQREVTDLIAMALDMDIPPGKAGHRVQAVSGALSRDADLLACNAHMHLRGQQFRFTLRRPDGTRELLLDIPRYDFNWQTTYRLTTPMRLKKGSRIECEAIFDNSAANRANPDPKARVGFGEQTTDEMMIGSMEVSPVP